MGLHPRALVDDGEDRAGRDDLSEAILWLANGEQLRVTQAADALQLPYMCQWPRQRALHPFEYLRAVVKKDRHEGPGKRADAGKFYSLAAQHDLARQRERYGTFATDLESDPYPL